MYQDGNYLYPGQYCQTRYGLWGGNNTENIPGKQVLTVEKIIMNIWVLKEV